VTDDLDDGRDFLSPRERCEQAASILVRGIRRLLAEGPADRKETPDRPAPDERGIPFIIGTRAGSDPRTIVMDINPAWRAAREQRRERRRNPRPPKPPGARSAPRVSRLLAVAHRFERRLRRGEVTSFAEIAAAERLTRARVTQIMDLLLLAPDLQERVLFLPRPASPDEKLSERDLRQIVRAPVWSDQRRIWAELRAREHVRVFFDDSVASRAREARWGADRHVHRVRGGIEVTTKLFPKPDFLAWVLAFGDKAEVLEPASLREQVAAELARASARYRPMVEESVSPEAPHRDVSSGEENVRAPSRPQADPRRTTSGDRGHPRARRAAPARGGGRRDRG
jgi:hypothetical protein